MGYYIDLSFSLSLSCRDDEGDDVGPEAASYHHTCQKDGNWTVSSTFCVYSLGHCPSASDHQKQLRVPMQTFTE